ncbi:oligosaccharide flippase family protein, partial [Vibrio makurazakiensis]|uniref:oligosaccharide flippase family protein n=1 Tax=Vibrio makurazakiensis TaxID=2910250 RepID=UPI003D0F9399
MVKNFLWLVFEKFFSVFFGYFVTIYTARYLGPDSLGSIVYCLSISAMIVPIGQLGSQSIVFDRAAKKSKLVYSLIESGKTPRLICFSVMVLLIFTMNVVFNKVDNILLLLAFVSVYATTIDSYKPYFDGMLMSKVNAIYNQIGSFSSQIVRVFLTKMTNETTMFMIPYIILSAIPYVLRKVKYNKEVRSALVYKEHKNRKLTKLTYTLGAPLAVSGFSIVIYTKINELLLGSLLGMKEVAIFNTSVFLSSSWAFISISLLTSLLGDCLSKKHNKENNLSKVFFILTIVSMPFIVVIFIFGDFLVDLLYGKEFSEMKDILSILSISSLFSIFGSFGYRVIVSYSGYKFLMYKMIFTGLISLPISYCLILYFGLEGAAISILVIEFFSSTVIN